MSRVGPSGRYSGRLIMVDEVNDISFDEFAEIFKAKAKLEKPTHAEIVRAWNVWQRQGCLLCLSDSIKFRALFEPGPKVLSEYQTTEDKCGLLMYSLCDVCFEHDYIENVSEVLLKASLGCPVH